MHDYSFEMQASTTISEACILDKKSYFAVSDIGSKYINPITMSHLYKPIVLPSILYECKLLSHMNQSDHQQLNPLRTLFTYVGLTYLYHFSIILQ